MIRALLSGVLYAAIAFGANPAFAAPLDVAQMKALRVGEMTKLAVAATPVDLPAIAVTDRSGAKHYLTDHKGKYVLVNFWATWCAPCRKEMPALDALQQKLGGDDFTVTLVAVGRNPGPVIDKFFAKAKITHLATWLDPDQDLTAGLGVFGLPVSVLLNPEGQEIARLRGDADWNSPEVLTYFKALIAGTDG